MGEARQKSINWWLVLSLIFLHFMVVKVGGYPLTVTPVAIAVFLLFGFRASVRINALYWLGGGVVWPFVVYLMYEVVGGSADFIEFARTYALWCYATLAMTIATLSPMKVNRDYSPEFRVVLIAIIIFSLAQVTMKMAANSELLYNPFGEHTYMGAYKVERFAGEGFARAPGFYLEPSFCAFMLFFLVSAVLIRVRQKGAGNWFLLGLLGTAIVGSATGLLAMAVLGMTMAVTHARKRATRILLSVVLFTVVVFASSIILYSRLNEIGVEGTSGYWRLIAPLIILSKVFAEYPFGVPFGQIEAFLLPLGLQHGDTVGSSIDNGVYFLAFYFGWFAVPLPIFLAYKYLKKIIDGDSAGAIYWWFVLFSLQFSGGILLPEYIFPLILITFQYRGLTYKKRVDLVALRYSSRASSPILMGGK